MKSRRNKIFLLSITQIPPIIVYSLYTIKFEIYNKLLI